MILVVVCKGKGATDCASLARARPSLKELYFGDESTDDDTCFAALLKDLALEKISMDGNRVVTSAVVDLFLRSPTAETLTYASFNNVDAFTSASILRFARGCPKLVDLYWSVDGTTRHANGQNVDDLMALLKGRGEGIADQEIEIETSFGSYIFRK